MTAQEYVLLSLVKFCVHYLSETNYTEGWPCAQGCSEKNIWIQSKDVQEMVLRGPRHTEVQILKEIPSAAGEDKTKQRQKPSNFTKGVLSREGEWTGLRSPPVYGKFERKAHSPVCLPCDV